MLGALRAYAAAKQAVIITPFILSGAMAPASVAGTLIQANAEVLAGIAYAQMVQPGTPVVYGTFQTTIDMQSGAPVLGAPESQQTLLLSAQMARHYNLPFRSGGGFASSKIPDAQAAYESAMSLQATVAGRVNFVLHATGWLEGGLTAGYEKFVLDSEVLGMMHKLMQPVDFSDEGMAMESIRTVEPGGHHLGTEHTMRHMRTAFYQAELFDYNSAEQWESEGSQDAVQRANAKYKQLLNTYEAPPLDTALDEALTEFIQRRKDEIVPTY
jgi:trimethylamine--corrinoid protein Co-methyltransferase